MNRTDIEKRFPAQRGEESTPGYRALIEKYLEIYKDQHVAMHRCPVHAAKLHAAALSRMSGGDKQERVSDL